MQFSESSLRMIRAHNPDLIDRHVAATIMGVTVRTLQRWYRQGIGPQRTNAPHRRPIRYSRTETEKWSLSHSHTAGD
jgi:hypothetical protein